ncbi:MAG: lactate utilization protein [Desulfobacterales bacterium]|nr:lactate utilization protein [Desulfobacterales bacterium]
MGAPENLNKLFKDKAEAVSAIVSEVASLNEALSYAVEICDRKEACQLLISGCEEELSSGAAELCEQKQKKSIAAPALDADLSQELASLCHAKGIDVVTKDLRKHVAGIDIGFTVVDYGIAETGTLVLDSSSEDTRLATMISEVHVAVVPKSKIRPTAFEVENELIDLMGQSPNYTAFITGASRTADIERVLALGVHGPLELHILMWEDH